ncbi:replication enhancer protein [Euphorbia yellow mosaic virus-[tomato:Brazil:2001]]|nr:replication enhancer protein [Euphorbia yellow mosaic virus-[tomato:Brazil:2001]]
MDLSTGEFITVSQAENSVFIWEVPNPLYFKIIGVEDPIYTSLRIYHIQIRFNYNLRRALNLTQSFPELPSLDDIDSSFWDDLFK